MTMYNKNVGESHKPDIGEQMKVDGKSTCYMRVHFYKVQMQGGEFMVLKVRIMIIVVGCRE